MGPEEWIMHLVIAERNVDNNLSARVPAGVSANNLPFQPRASKTFPSRAYVTIFPLYRICNYARGTPYSTRRKEGGGEERLTDGGTWPDSANIGVGRSRFHGSFFARPNRQLHAISRISIPNFLTQLETRELTCKTFTLCFVYLFTCKICRIYRCSLFHLYLFRWEQTIT